MFLSQLTATEDRIGARVEHITMLGVTSAGNIRMLPALVRPQTGLLICRAQNR